MKLRFVSFFALCAGLIARLRSQPGRDSEPFQLRAAQACRMPPFAGPIFFDIYGTNIGPATLTQASGFPLPVQLASTSVQVNVAGVNSDVLLFFVSTATRSWDFCHRKRPWAQEY